MNGSIFVDTNVLVYSRDASKLEKQTRASEWISHLWESGTGRLSVQVLAEYYAVVTGKLKPGMETASAREDVEDLFSWRPLPMTPDLITGAWVFQDLLSFLVGLAYRFGGKDSSMHLPLERGFPSLSRFRGDASH